MEQSHSLDGIQYQLNWPTWSDEDILEVIHFWEAQSAMPQGASMAERASELLCTAKDETNKLLCTSSVYHKHVKDLDEPFFCYRTFAASDARLMKVAVNMLNFSHSFLETLTEKQGNEVGFYIEVESPQLMKYQNEATWFESRCVYFGTTPEGWHRRLRYFEHALLKHQ